MMSVDSTPHLFEIHPGTQTFLSFFKVAFSNSSPGFLKIFQRDLKKKKNKSEETGQAEGKRSGRSNKNCSR